jgi:hypothetical protein
MTSLPPAPHTQYWALGFNVHRLPWRCCLQPLRPVGTQAAAAVLVKPWCGWPVSVFVETASTVL